MTKQLKAGQRFTLKRLVSNEALRNQLKGYEVRIWSGEHGAWWRSQRSGYSSDILGAGIYAFSDAYKSLDDLGPEKKIILEIAEHFGEPLPEQELLDRYKRAGVAIARKYKHPIQGARTLLAHDIAHVIQHEVAYALGAKRLEIIR